MNGRRNFSQVVYEYRRREMLPTIRTDVIRAYKGDFKTSVDQFTIAANVFYALGAATDIGVRYQSGRATIPGAFGDDFADSVRSARSSHSTGHPLPFSASATHPSTFESGHFP
jgi:hypothetical protein